MADGPTATQMTIDYLFTVQHQSASIHLSNQPSVNQPALMKHSWIISHQPPR